MGVLSACVLRLAPQVVSICDTGGYDAYSLVGDATLVPARKYFTVSAYTVSTSPHPRHACNSPPKQEYPVARGHVHIKHAEDVSEPLDFVAGYFESSA